MSGNTKIKYSYANVKIEQEYFDALRDICNKKGINVGEGFVRAAMEYIVAEAKNGGSEYSLVTAAAIEQRKHDAAIDMLRKLGNDYLQDSTEEKAEKLIRLCMAMGISHDQLLAELKQKPELTVLHNENGGVRKAGEWLVKYMRPGEFYPATIVAADAARAGILPYALKEARRALSITSARRATYWEWLRPAIQAELDFAPLVQRAEEPDCAMDINELVTF